MKRYILTMRDNGEFADIQKMGEGDIIIGRSYFEELITKENNYNKLQRMSIIKGFKGHYSVDPIRYAVHILKDYLNAYLQKNTTEHTGIVEKRMLVVSFCHRIEEGLIDYLDELEEFNS